MSAPKESKTWQLSKKPTDDPVLSGPDATFKLTTETLPELKEGQILVKVCYLSNDPAQRGWIDPNIDESRLYRPPVKVGDVMSARGLGQVVDSKSEKFKKDAWVLGNTDWNQYVIFDDKDPAVREAVDLPGGLSRTHYLGALGSTGLTAYYGLVEIAQAQKGQRILVSGAAGATGSMVVQIAKHIVGASYVVGIAGTDDKCKWVVESGADKCLNYKSPGFAKDFDAAAGDGFDVYFDNVGGEILDMALLRMKKFGIIAACGAISGYNSGNKWTSQNYFNIISMRLQLRGFIVLDHLNKAAETIGIFRKALTEGKLKLGPEHVTVVPTEFEDVPKTWLMLFEGKNQGKLVTELK